MNLDASQFLNLALAAVVCDVVSQQMLLFFLEEFLSVDHFIYCSRFCCVSPLFELWTLQFFNVSWYIPHYYVMSSCKMSSMPLDHLEIVNMLFCHWIPYDYSISSAGLMMFFITLCFIVAWAGVDVSFYKSVDVVCFVDYGSNVFSP